MFVLSSISSGWRFSTVTQFSIYKSSEWKVSKEINILHEISNN